MITVPQLRKRIYPKRETTMTALKAYADEHQMPLAIAILQNGLIGPTSAKLLKHLLLLDFSLGIPPEVIANYFTNVFPHASEADAEDWLASMVIIGVMDVSKKGVWFITKLGKEVLQQLPGQ